MRKVVGPLEKVVCVNDIPLNATVGLIVAGTKYVSVKNRGESRVRKMCYTLEVEGHYYGSNRELLHSFGTKNAVIFDNTTEAIKWLVS